ncbi:hypothetical protein BP5796_10298 [Coleophoma crateriformis]|uniref:Uncharacterized protein n=1 Tax=Coleophoma crateriformis TaxID=565419 RepID=A0A3D8QUT6_9HELO|nr:hypothetical protein BP5796_10298 [Coleophoma crateriformis]
MTTMKIDPSAAARERTARIFIDTFATFSTGDCLLVRTPNCVQQFAPHSIAPPTMSNSAFAAHLAHLGEVMSSFPLTVKEMIDNPTANQVLIWATASPLWLPSVTGGVGKSGAGGEEVDWAYTGEYMFLLSFEDGEAGEDGNGGKLKRLERVIEFVDSKGTTKLYGLMEKARRILRGVEV